MTLAEKLSTKSEAIENKQELIINEIVDSFKTYFAKDNFEEEFSKRFYEDEIRKRQKITSVEFWDYNSGCGDTNFRISYITWKNPENTGWESRNYKGICLHDIQKRVGPILLDLAVKKFTEMGFRVRVEDDESWLKYYKKKLTLSW